MVRSDDKNRTYWRFYFLIMTISDLNAEVRSLCDADTTSYTAADLLRRVNTAYETVISWIITADGTWQFDDTNFTDHPRGTGTLVEGQEDYSFSSEYLDIEAIEILNNSSPATYVRIRPLDHADLGNVSPEEHFGLTAAGNPATGFPRRYDKNGDTIRLYPAPAAASGVTLASGIRVWFKRTADLFTAAQVTTGTKEPGFASPFHTILAYMAAIPFCMSYKKDRVALYKNEIEIMKRDLIVFYGHREFDKRKVMTKKFIRFI